MAWDIRQRDEYLQHVLPGGVEALKKLLPTKFAALQQEAQRRGINEFQVLAQMDPARCEALFTGTKSARFTMNQSPPQPSPAYVPGGTQNLPANPYALAPPPALPQPPQNPAGLQEKIAQYDVWVELGKGGMGRAVLAYDPKLKRRVVVKTILGAGGAEAKLRFKREGEALARIQHENVVRVYDAGDDGKQMYIAMESINGAKDLRKFMPELITSPDRFTKTAQIMHGTALGMAAAHQQRILHRDLKPENVLITENGIPKVIDFGLAKDKVDDLGLTLEDTILGTPDYMPPEQITGQTKEIDERSDTYSLGAILYELIAISRPYAGRNMIELAEQIADSNKTPPSPRTLDKSIPIELETIALKALRKNKEERYQTAQELADDLERYLNNEPILAMPEGIGKRAVRAAKRNKAPILAGLALLAGIYAGISGYRAQQSELDLVAARADAKEAEAARLKIEQESAQKLRTQEAEARLARRNFYLNEKEIAAREQRANDEARYCSLVIETIPQATHDELLPENANTLSKERKAELEQRTLLEARVRELTGNVTLRIVLPEGVRAGYQLEEVNPEAPNGLVQVFPPSGVARATEIIPGKRGRAYRLSVDLERGADYSQCFTLASSTDVTIMAPPELERLRGFRFHPQGRSGFYLSQWPITWADYSRFLASVPQRERAQFMPADERGAYTRERLALEQITGMHPVTGITVAQAEAYAAYLQRQLPDGYRAGMPTPEQLESAVVSDGRTYPWGNAMPPEMGRIIPLERRTNLNGTPRALGELIPDTGMWTGGTDQRTGQHRPADPHFAVTLQGTHILPIRVLVKEGNQTLAGMADAFDDAPALHGHIRASAAPNRRLIYRQFSRTDRLTGMYVAIEPPQ